MSTDAQRPAEPELGAHGADTASNAQTGASKRFWNIAARENAAWYIATGFTSESPEFFESGRREVDEYLALAGVRLEASDTIVEIGCGAGRMTRRLAELAGTVIAADVSGEMLDRARVNVPAAAAAAAAAATTADPAREPAATAEPAPDPAYPAPDPAYPAPEPAATAAAADSDPADPVPADSAPDAAVHRAAVAFVELSGDGDLPLPDASATAVFSYITMQHVPTVRAQLAYLESALRVVAPGGWVLMQYRRSGLVPRLLDWIGHLRHLLRGRRTLDRAWRGARVPEAALLAFASAELSVRLLHPTRRHTWVLARRAG